MNSRYEKKTGSLALKAGVWYVISSVTVKAVSILTTPIFTRILSTEEYGVVSAFSSWYSLLLPLCTLNLTYSIGRAKLDFPNELDDYIGTMQVLAAILTGAVAVLAFIFLKPLTLLMGLDRGEIILMLLYLFCSPAIIFRQNGYRYRYQYKQNIAIAWYMALGNVCLSLLLLLLVNGEKIILRILGTILPVVFLSVIFWVRTIWKQGIQIKIEYWKYGIRLSAPLVLHTVSINILSQSDRILVMKICGKEAAGIYSLAYLYALMMSVVTNAVSDGWLPWFHDKYFEKKFDEIKEKTKEVVVLGCYIGLASIALAPEAIKILGGEVYMEGVMCIPPIVMGVVCQYIYTHYVNIEMHLKKTKYVSAGTVLASVINIVLNIVCIPRFGYIAAAYTTLVSYMLLLVVHYCITVIILRVRIYDDLFMFGAIGVTILSTGIIELSYQNNMFRYCLIGIGFLSFIWVFRKYLWAFSKYKFF